MKNPLHYQLSEYDCGPTSMMNAIAYLFEREEIPPEAIRNTMLSREVLKKDYEERREIMKLPLPELHVLP